MTTTFVFQGTPEALKVKVDALISGGKIIDQIIVCSAKSYYLICYH